MSRLLDATYRLLDDTEKPLREIAAESGVNFHWLAKFKQRAHRNPGVISVQRLHDYLQSRRPETDHAAA